MAPSRMGIFAGLDVRLDPWQVEYGSEIPLSAADEAAEPEVDASVEIPAAEWRPLLSSDVRPPKRVVFIDGIRRIEARVLARRGGRLCHGAFGSFAVGAVACGDGVAVREVERVERVLALDSGESLPEPVPVTSALVYRPVSTSQSDAEAPLARIQEEMRLAEERLGRDLADREDTLVVADGPLTFGDPVRGGAVGFIKRLFKTYVGPALLPVLAALPAGGRSPLFALRGVRFARYSWFLRLARPGRGDSDLAGIVRLEVAETVGSEAARRLADATAAFLPRFAPSRGRDPRAPQNLLPIGALEASLRRRLGDARVIRRHIASRIAAEVS